MANRKLIVTSEFPYHVFCRANNREEFPAEPDRLWRVFGSSAYEIHVLFDARIHALVQMPNHFHMLITTPGEDLGRVMQTFMWTLTREVNRRTGRFGRLFEGPYRRTLIDSPTSFSHALKYVYRNPVKAGICTNVEDYSYSTLNGILGRSTLHVPIFEAFPSRTLRRMTIDPELDLPWLNRPFRSEHLELVQRALRKQRFQFPSRTQKSVLGELRNERI